MSFSRQNFCILISGCGNLAMIHHQRVKRICPLNRPLHIPCTSSMSFGDGGNDIDLLKEVGTGAAEGGAACRAAIKRFLNLFIKKQYYRMSAEKSLCGRNVRTAILTLFRGDSSWGSAARRYNGPRSGNGCRYSVRWNPSPRYAGPCRPCRPR